MQFSDDRSGKRAQMEFLLHLIRTDSSDLEVDKLRSLSVNDWIEVMRLSARHKVAPILYQRLAEKGLWEDAAVDILEKPRGIYQKTLWRNSQLYHNLSGILGALRDEGISVIILKGTALAKLVYQNVALRPMEDIDLIVKNQEIWQVNRILLKLGFENTSFSTSERHVHSIRHLEYANKFPGVDVHTRIPEIPGLDPWPNAVHISIDSNDAVILGASDFLLHLCLHLEHHTSYVGSSELIRWYDIAKLIEHYQQEIDWDYLIATSRKHRVLGIVNHVLLTVHKWFEAEIPEDVLGRNGNEGIEIPIDELFDSEYAGERTSGRISSSVSPLSHLTSFRDKVGYLLRKIVPRKAFIVRRYSLKNPKYAYFYYFVRIFSLFGKALKSLFHLPVYLRKRSSSGSGQSM